MNSEIIAPAEILLTAPPPEAATPTWGFLSSDKGFLPPATPLQALPPSHSAWDEIAADLPALIRSATLRRAVDALPLLQADARALPDRFLRRANLIVGILAHAYVREGESKRLPLTGSTPGMRSGIIDDPVGTIPDVLDLPWTILSERLGRPEACLHFDDLAAYNWRLRDPESPLGLCTENLTLLVPTVDSSEERGFYNTIVESMAVLAPLTAEMARLQTAALRRDREGLYTGLGIVFDLLRQATRTSLQKIDPNPEAEESVDPLLWAKLVAPLAAPIRKGELGLSGGASPSFLALDVFFGRTRQDTKMGRETREIHRWLPEGPGRFIGALREVSIPDILEEWGDRALLGAWEQALDLYAGRHGWLGVHRLKVYGFMETGFRAGRNATNGGFSGSATARAWDRLDDNMEEARQERFGRPQRWHLLSRSRVEHLSGGAVGSPGNHLVRIDLLGSGLRYEPGDWLEVLAVSRPPLVDRTLRALQADGTEHVALTAAWRAHLAGLGQGDGATLPLREFLRYAQLRPLSRHVGKRLQRLTSSGRLQDVLERRQEDQLELADALALAAADNYDTSRFWKAEPWEAESLPALLPPMAPRIYSIGSAPPEQSLPDHLELVVHALQYTPEVSPPDTSGQPAQASPPVHRGASSTYLTRPLDEEEPALPARIVAPLRFKLPRRPAVPVVMFAAGSGIAPFRGFWQARAQQDGAGPTVLLFGGRTPADLLFSEEMRAAVEAGSLECHTIFSRTDKRLVGSEGRWVLADGSRGYVDALLQGELGKGELGKRLFELLSQGGAHAYICGRAAFAHTVVAGLEALAHEHGADGSAFVTRLVAEGRLQQDVFTTFAPLTTPGLLGNATYEVSDVVRHNNPEDGYWMVVNGQVYDMTGFMARHPGGDRILVGCAGIDATTAWEKVNHHLSPGVRSMLDLYKIGALRRLDFGGTWGIALTAEGVKTVTLLDVYKRWLGFLYAVVEAENTRRNNRALAEEQAFPNQGPPEGARLCALMRLDLQALFDQTTVDLLLGDPLETLWQHVIGITGTDRRPGELSKRIREVRGGAAAAAHQEAVMALFRDLRDLETVDDASVAAVSATINAFDQHAMDFLGAMKASLRDGIRLFERHEAGLLHQEGDGLVARLLEIPEHLHSYYRTTYRAHTRGAVRDGET